MQLVKARRTGLYARICLDGPSGSGKTWTALELATGLKGDGKIVVLDTERGSAKKYAEDFEFFTGTELPDFSPDNYTRFVNDIGEISRQEGVTVLVIDSATHAWSGKGGALESVDRIARKSQTGNSFTAWRDVTPMHNRFVDAMLSVPLHLIVTLRTKTEYVMEKNEQGKTVPRKVGMAPIQRDGFEYEFDLMCDMDLEHNMSVSKTRYRFLDGVFIHHPDRKIGEQIREWLSGASPDVIPLIVNAKDLEELVSFCTEHKINTQEISTKSKEMFGVGVRDLTPTQLDRLKLEYLKD